MSAELDRLVRRIRKTVEGDIERIEALFDNAEVTGNFTRANLIAADIRHRHSDLLVELLDALAREEDGTSTD